MRPEQNLEPSHATTATAVQDSITTVESCCCGTIFHTEAREIMGTSTSNHITAQAKPSPAFSSFLPLFSLSFCGLVAVRIWIQCNLYDRYTSTDSGIITIVSNLARVALIVILIAIVVRHGFPKRSQRMLGYASAFAMTAASILFLVNVETPNHIVLFAACVCAGCGIVWGGGIWITVYERFPPDEALIYAFLSLGASSMLGFLLGLLPATFTYLVALVMPALSLVMLQRSSQLLDERDEALRTSSGAATLPKRDTVYDGEPKSTFARLIAGMALFNLALGIARGYPSGESIALTIPFQAIHQFSVLLISLALIWWAVAKRRSIRFSTLWNISVTLIIIGVLLLALSDSTATLAGATFISISNTFAVGLLWFSCYDIARHSSIPSYLILGVGWLAHVLPREIGRAGIWLLEPHSSEAILVIAFVVLLLALAMVFLLNDSIPVKRHLFAEFRSPQANASVQAALADRYAAPAGDPASRQEGEPAHDGATPKVREEAPYAEHLSQLGKQYSLTERELEVVGLLAQGRSRISIGEKLYISENTVRTYVKNIYAKLDIHSKQELLDRLEEQGSHGQDESKL